MNSLLPVLGFCAEDFAQAETLLDYIAVLRDKQPRGYILLAAAPNTHPEMHKRLEIAAKVGFDHVGVLTVGWPKESPHGKPEQINLLFHAAAKYVRSNYKSDFLWFEPDSVPLGEQWLSGLERAYDQQHKRYLASFLTNPKGEKFLGRVMVCPNDAADDLAALDVMNKSRQPFEMFLGQQLVAKASKTPLIQQLRIGRETKPEAIRPEALLLHGDKEGILLARRLDEAIKQRNRPSGEPLVANPNALKTTIFNPTTPPEPDYDKLLSGEIVEEEAGKETAGV